MVGARHAGSYPIYYSGRYTDTTVTKTKWVVQEMADGSPIPGTRNFGESLPLVSYEMNMASLPFDITSFHPAAVIRAGHVQADAPGPQFRAAIVQGHEAIISDYIAYFKDDHGHAAQDMHPEERQDKLDDFQRRIVPEVRKKLVWKKAKTAHRVARRFLLSQVLPKRNGSKVAINLSIPLPTLWYEDENGAKWVPDLRADYPADQVPEGFVYQHSRFPRTLTETVLRLITQEDVDECSHEEILVDHGLIEGPEGSGAEGRICRSCGGSQTKKVGEPWPAEWHGGGSRDVGSGSSSFPSDLVLAMTRPTPDEIHTAEQRGHTIVPVDFDVATILAATSCERCLNVLLYRHGCDDGYEEGSAEWQKANTRCDLCV